MQSIAINRNQAFSATLCARAGSPSEIAIRCNQAPSSAMKVRKVQSGATTRGNLVALTRGNLVAISWQSRYTRLLEHNGRLRSLEMHDLFEGRRVVVGVPIEL